MDRLVCVHRLDALHHLAEVLGSSLPVDLAIRVAAQVLVVALPDHQIHGDGDEVVELPVAEVSNDVRVLDRAQVLKLPGGTCPRLLSQLDRDGFPVRRAYGRVHRALRPSSDLIPEFVLLAVIERDDVGRPRARLDLEHLALEDAHGHHLLPHHVHVPRKVPNLVLELADDLLQLLGDVLHLAGQLRLQLRIDRLLEDLGDFALEESLELWRAHEGREVFEV
mmetsp:Transcript_9659/g.23550  ORF Transcript_9659/g.23550 Transcript_9659/m.23550 type:complete len:222 (-) Transcript_9659:1505-2170(-)